MDIGGSIRRKNRETVVIKSIVWKTIIDIFKERKAIDITDYIVSITFRGSVIFVKTHKTTINYELLQIQDIITKETQTKLKKIWIIIKDMEIRFL
jgi:predicted mannosyl-3-phosphoglycerate phosphatase (HAD superfamily)